MIGRKGSSYENLATTENVQRNTITQVPCSGFVRHSRHLGVPDNFTPRHTKHGKHSCN